MWYVVYMGCAESAEEVRGGVDVTHTHTCTVVYYDCDYDWLGGFSFEGRNIWVGFFGVAGILATPIYIPYTPSVSRLTPLKVPLTHLKGAIFAQMC